MVTLSAPVRLGPRDRAIAPRRLSSSYYGVFLQIFAQSEIKQFDKSYISRYIVSVLYGKDVIIFKLTTSMACNRQRLAFTDNQTLNSFVISSSLFIYLFYFVNQAYMN